MAPAVDVRAGQRATQIGANLEGVIGIGLPKHDVGRGDARRPNPANGVASPVAKRAQPPRRPKLSP
jgi:hypothetical protein